MPFTVKANWKEKPGWPLPYGLVARVFQWGYVRAFVAQEPTGKNGALLWHLSVSTPYRYPTYDEMKAARYDLVPDNATMAMIFPPRQEFVNEHKFCFHLYQIEEGETQ